MKPKTEHFKWVAEISVDKIWIEDGFDLTEKCLHEAVTKLLPYAYKDEFSVRIVRAPPEALLKGLRK